MAYPAMPKSFSMGPPYVPVHRMQKSANALKRLIFLYFILLIFEGSLRKWIVPSAADLLLIIRDPLVLLIYVLAFRQRVFPFNGFISALVWITIVSIPFSILSSNGNFLVMLYGMRVNFLHIPLLFLMPSILTREDLWVYGKLILWMSIPMALLIFWQFHSGIDTFINRSIGGQVGGIMGVAGKFRPTGTFSFVTGVAAFYPLVAAFLMDNFLGERKFKWPFLVAFSMAVITALPFSISRQAVLATGLVMVFSLIAAFSSGRNMRYVFRLSIAVFLVGLILVVSPFLSAGMDAFMERWSSSTGVEQGGFETAILYRYFTDLSCAWDASFDTPFFGIGLGMGSNVGAKLMTGNVGFMLSESEWARIVMEMGPLLGWIFIIYRIFMSWFLWSCALLSARKHHDGLPILLFGVALPLMFNGQWGPPTNLGFAIFASGLCLVAARNPPVVKGKIRYAHQAKSATHQQFYRR